MAAIAIKRPLFLLGLAAVLVVAGCTSTGPPTPPSTADSSGLVSKVDNLTLRFASLSSSRTNFCAGPNFMASKTDSDRLQGACCSQMDFHRYAGQVEGLKNYSAISQIPPDPYDIPVPLVKELLEYQKTITLTSEQQAIYDEAVKMSHEGGPCCCKCWRWYAFEGQAKYLITRHGFTAKQVADVWDLEDGCGGSGHVHGDHMATEPRQVFDPR